MKALVFDGVEKIRYTEEFPRPTLQDSKDVIVAISLCGLCGSDMHPYKGREVGIDVGTVPGHEFVGSVIEAGADVVEFKVGDRVCCPFTVSCGACFFCRKHLSARCVHSQLFGWRENGAGLHGGQAEMVRVPLADATLMRIPDDEEALLCGDIFSTGFFCAQSANLAPAAKSTAPDSSNSPEASLSTDAQGPTSCAVVGCGPVGLMAIVAARSLGACPIFAVDQVPERLQLAEEFGAVAVNLSEDPVAVVRAATGGFGSAAVLEVVGSPAATRLAYNLVQPGGTISSVGCHTSPEWGFTPVDGYNKNITYRSGRCPARSLMPLAMKRVMKAQLPIAKIITHRLPLSAGPEAYRMFDAKASGCIKIVFDPHM
eukprot:jgi/Mesvir1/14385/Mv09782-RA.2